MNLKSFIEKWGLDWKDTYFTPGSGTAYSYHYPIKPEEFLTFAKEDFFNADTRALVNALSNAKRAIDCQVDTFISALGLNPEKLDRQLGPHGVKSLAHKHPGDCGTLKLRFLQSLGVATPDIVSRMRRLRNLLEHEYRRPRKKDVSDSIGVAELFVQACRGRLNSPLEEFAFGSGTTSARGEKQVAREFHIRFNCDNLPCFSVHFWDHEKIAKDGTGSSPSLEIELKDEGFVPLLKLMWRAEWGVDMTVPVHNFFTELGMRPPASRFRVKDGDYLNH